MLAMSLTIPHGRAELEVLQLWEVKDSFSRWKSEFCKGRVVLFVDNEGTKFSLLKGLSDNECVDNMAELFAELGCKGAFKK